MANTLRSINSPVTQKELSEAEELVSARAQHTRAVRAELARAENEETAARNALGRIRRAVAKSGLIA
jgi:hypothetical protein